MALALLFVSGLVLASAEPLWKQVLVSDVGTGTPVARYYHSSVASVDGDSLIAFGGTSYQNGVTFALNDTWFFDLRSRQWTEAQLSDAPAARGYHSAVLSYSQKRMVVFGGKAESVASDLFADTWFLDLAVLPHVWTPLFSANSSDVPAARFWHSASLTRDSLMLVFGGFSWGGFLNDLWLCDVVSGAWTLLIPNATAGSPSARHGHSVAAYNDGFLLFGGRADAAQGLGGSNDVWLYQLSSNSWKQLSSDSNSSAYPAQRFAASAVVQNNQLVIFGGTYVPVSSNDGNSFFADTWAFDLVSLTWSQLNTMVAPDARNGHTATIVNSTAPSLLLFGGYAQYEGLQNDLWSFY